jgi:AraC-like DNA-binding protein
MVMLYIKVVLLLSDHEQFLFAYDRDVVFVLASVFVMVIAYYVFKHEEIFRIPVILVRTEDLEPLKITIDTVMKEKKCFQNQHLTLTEFAEAVNIKPHLLSKVINECYQQNFRDFVNKYRVEEFIRIAQKDSNKHLTFLALANEVGFNSKSTFNAAFKKITGRSPREFFKANQVIAE